MLLLLLLLTAQVPTGTDPRYRELKRAVNKNTGFAHATRGMNAYTLFALRSCVSTSDIPVLARMLRDPDHVVAMTAAYVLADLGPAGLQPLRSRLETKPTPRERLMLEEALTAKSSKILDYPLTPSERKKIRACRVAP